MLSRVPWALAQISCYHRCNCTLKSGGDQWRRQDLVSGGTTIEAQKARASTRQRRRVGSGMGRGVPSQPTWESGERRELPSGVWGGALAAIAFSACFRPQNASGSKKKNTILLQIPLWKSGGDSYQSPPSHTKLRLWSSSLSTVAKEINNWRSNLSLRIFLRAEKKLEISKKKWSM